MPYLLPLLLSLSAAVLLPLALTAPVHYRGRARERAGKLPGWEGPGWQLWHVWLAFSLLICAELLVLYFVQPQVFASVVARDPVPAIDLQMAGADVGRHLLWTTAAVGATFLIVVPLAPLRMLWTRRWSIPAAIGGGALAFVLLRLATLLLAPALPSLMSEDHPQRELTESLARLTSTYSLWLTLALGALIAPIVEEVLFRGVLLTGLARHISFGWSNAIQSALFATLHLAAALFPIFFLMGLLAGELTRRSGGLLAPITLHVFNNAAALLTLWWLQGRPLP